MTPYNLPPGVGVHDLPGNEHPQAELWKQGTHRGETYSIAPARYAKGKCVVQCRALVPDGYKTEGAWLAEALGGRWVHRSHGHQMAPSRARAWMRLFLAGFEASRKYFAGDKRPYTFSLPGSDAKLTLAQALAQCEPEDAS